MFFLSEVLRLFSSSCFKCHAHPIVLTGWLAYDIIHKPKNLVTKERNHMKEFIYRLSKGITIVSVLFLANTSRVLASGGCVPVYGGGVQCPPSPQVMIN